jgi:hypothetical protein
MMVNAFFVVASLMVEKFVIIYCNLVVGQAWSKHGNLIRGSRRIL